MHLKDIDEVEEQMVGKDTLRDQEIPLLHFHQDHHHVSSTLICETLLQRSECPHVPLQFEDIVQCWYCEYLHQCRC